MERFLSTGAVTSAALRSTSMRRIAPSGPLPMRAVRSTPRIDASCRAAGDAPYAAARAAFHDHPRSWRQRNARRRNNRGSNRSSTLCRPRHCRECGLGLLIRTDPGKRRADGHFGADLDQHLLNPTGFENFDLDRTLLCLDNGDDIASLHMVSRLHRPFDQSARLHVGAERGGAAAADMAQRAAPQLKAAAARLHHFGAAGLDQASSATGA